MLATRIPKDQKPAPPEPPRFPVFRQSNDRRVKWDLFVMSLAVWNCFSIPFVLCFEISEEDLTIPRVFDVMVDILFAIDIVVVFNTTYIDSKTGQEIFDRKKITLNYLKSPRFTVDVLATIPIDSIAELAGSSSSIFALFGLLKMIRILRLSKIILSMRVMEKIKIYMKLLQLMLNLLMYLHIGACLWHIIVTRDTDWWPSTNIIIGKKLYYSSDVWYQYFLSFYTSVSMLVGIEIMPQNTDQVAYSCGMILLGAMISAVMFGQMVILVTSLNAKATDFNELITTANTTMNNLKLPTDLQFKIIDYIISTQENQAQQDDYAVFKEIIPPSLIKRVNSSIYKDIMLNTPIFCDYDQATHEIMRNITNGFEKPEELIVSQGQESDSLMFLVSGKLEVELETLDGDKIIMRDINEREYFGDFGVLFHTERTATVRVSKYANIGYVAKKDFYSIMYKNPELLEQLRAHATEKYMEDPNRKYFLKTIRRIPYFRNLEPFVLYTLMYKLKDENHDEGHVLFAEDEPVDKILFVYEGEIAVKFNVFDPIIKKRIKFFNREIETTKSFTKTGTLTKSKIHKNRMKDNIEFDWVLLGPGSILCWREALFRRPIQVKLECKVKTRFFFLKMDDIEEVAKTAPILKAQLEANKSKYVEVDPESKEKLWKTPKIDCFKHLPYRKDPKIINNLIKLKSAIVSCILRKREIRENKIQSISKLLKKLESILKAEGKGWDDIARKIEGDKLNPDILDHSDVLRHNELSKIILAQFAGTTKQVLSMHSTLFAHSEKLLKFLEEGESEEEFIEKQMLDIREIVRKIY